MVQPPAWRCSTAWRIGSGTVIGPTRCAPTSSRWRGRATRRSRAIGRRRGERQRFPSVATSSCGPRAWLANDAVLEVRDTGRLDRPDLLELDVRADAVEESRPAAQENRDDVDLELVHEPGGQVLVDDVRAAADEDVLVAGCLPRLVECGVDSIGHKGEGRV